MQRSVKGTATLVAMVVATSLSSAEHGSPGVLHAFDDEDRVPTNALMALPGTNGVPVGLEELKADRPRLVDEAGTAVPLRIVDSYDDMEGHDTPFPKDGGGYGENLILLAPQTELRPGAKYGFVVGTKKEHTLFSVTTGTGPDNQRPRWKRAPFAVAGPADPYAAEHPNELLAIPTRLVTAIDEPRDLPLFVEVELKPQQSKARPKRMIAALQLASDDTTPGCDYVTLWDHEHGVTEPGADRDVAYRYLARLTAIDAAGNRTSAPGPGVSILWSPGLWICNAPDETKPQTQQPRAPTWIARPKHEAVRDPHFDPNAQSVFTTPFEHRFTLPVRTRSALFVELTITNSKHPNQRFRRVARITHAYAPQPDHPLSQIPLREPPPKPPLPHPVDLAYCGTAEVLGPHDDASKIPEDAGVTTVYFALIDAYGRRVTQPGGPLKIRDFVPRKSWAYICLAAPKASPERDGG